MSKYLDDNGVLYLWSKIKGAFAAKEDIPTDNASLANGAGYTTMTAVEAKGYQTSQQVSAAISTAISGISGFEWTIVEELPAVGRTDTIYLKHKTTTATGNIYTEYLWVNGAWETLGDTAMDLTDYVKKEDITAITNAEIDSIVGGGSVLEGGEI